MNFPSILLLFLGITVVSGIIISDGDGGGKRKKKPRFDLSSESSLSSDSSEHNHHHNRPRSTRGPRRTTTSKPKGCPLDWMAFDRPQGKWCIKVFYGPVTQEQAERQCNAQGATLSGVQDHVERHSVANAARVLINQNGGGFGQTWLGGKRKAMCPYKESCPQMATFEWVDGHTTGIGGYWWGPYEPNGLIFPNAENPQAWGQENCLVSMVHPNCNNCPGLYGFWHGDMDDEHCQNSFRTYACGKRG